MGGHCHIGSGMVNGIGRYSVKIHSQAQLSGSVHDDLYDHGMDCHFLFTKAAACRFPAVFDLYYYRRYHVYNRRILLRQTTASLLSHDLAFVY